MSKKPEPNSAQKKRTRDVIEETFRRYEPKEETPSIPQIEETPQRVPSREKAQEELMAAAEIPSSKIVNTGIAEIDTALGGGIVDHSLILICGETGSQYDTFIQQILYNHSKENGKTAYYIADTLSIDIRDKLEQFNWNLQDFLSRDIWQFIDMRTNDLQQLADLSPKILSDKASVKLSSGLNSLKTDLLTRIKEERWTALELNHLLLNYDLKEIINLMLYWRAVIRTHGGIHFALLPTGVYSENQVNALKNLADGVIEFSLKEGTREYENILAIQKMKYLFQPFKLSFKIQPFTLSFITNGIVVDTAARIT